MVNVLWVDLLLLTFIEVCTERMIVPSVWVAISYASVVGASTVYQRYMYGLRMLFCGTSGLTFRYLESESFTMDSQKYCHTMLLFFKAFHDLIYAL